MTEQMRRELIEKAKVGREKAYAPVSHFKVGAALLGKSGQIYIGCNIESKSFGSLVCAERDALFQAITAGELEFEGIAVTSSSNDETFPCGICRQMMYEFMPEDSEVILEDKDGNAMVYILKDLLPHGFKLS